MHRRGSILGLVVFVALALVPLLTSSAAPLRQLDNPLLVVSNEGQAGSNVDKTLIRSTITDPNPNWRRRIFDASGWQDAYPSMRASDWTTGTDVAPLLDDGADHIWGGTPGGPLTDDAGNSTTYPRRYDGADYDNGYPIPTGPSPQYLFLRKDFCLPINAQADDHRRLTTGGGILTLLNATDSTGVPDGSASVWMNTVNIGVVGPGTVQMLPVGPGFLYRGRNGLTMRVGDARSDDMAALLYRVSLDYAINPTAIQVNVNPASPFEEETVNFNVTTDGLSDRPPYNYDWTFGDGGLGTGSSANHTYTKTGAYTVTLTIADTDACTGTTATQVTVLPHPLTITKTAQPDPVTAGETLLYRITVRNSSTVRALTNVVVTDTLPPSTTFSSCTGGCTPPVLPDRTVQWSLGSLGVGASQALTLYVSVDRAASGMLTNAAYGVRTDEVSAAGAPVSVDVLSPPLTPTLVLNDPNPCDLTFTYAFTATDPDVMGDLTATLTLTPTGVLGSPVVVTATGTGLITATGALTAPSCGLYTATVEIVDDEGLSNGTTATIYVNERPYTPALLLSDATPCDLAFDYSFSGADCDRTGSVTATLVITGITGAAPSVVVVTGTNAFDAAGSMVVTGCGTYTGTLTVVDDQGCTQTASDSISIFGAAPQVSMAVVTTGLSCSSYSVTYTIVPTFNDTCCTPMPYLLTFADGITQTGAFPTSGVPYTFPHDYSSSCNWLAATVVITCGDGCAATGQAGFSLNRPPEITNLAITQTAPCAPAIGYAATVSDCNGPDTLNWRLDFSDGGAFNGTGDTIAGSYTPVDPGYCGDITATLTVTDDHGCLAGRPSPPVNLNQPPEIHAAALAQPDPCTPVVTYTADLYDCDHEHEDDPLVSLWTFYEDGVPAATRTTASGNYTPTAGFCGLVTATLETSDGPCAATTTVTPAVDLNLPPVIQAATLTQPFPCPEVITFTSSAADCDGDPLSYLWTFYEEGRAAGSNANPAGVYIPTSGFCGAVTATLAVSDGTCTDTATATSTEPQFVYLPVILRNFFPPDAPDTCPGWSLSVGQPFDEDFDHAGDDDWFTFQATAGISYTIRTKDLEIRTDTVITLYDGTCTHPLIGNDDLPYPSNSRASQIEWRAVATGPLHILVRNYERSVYGPDTGYSLVVYDEDHPAPPMDDAPDFCAAAYPILTGQPYAEDFEYANDNDWFTFDVAAGRTYTITTGNLAARANTILELWDGDCLHRLAVDDNPSSPESQIVWSTTGDGRLSLKVRHYDWTIYGADTGYTVVVEEE